MNTNAIYIFPQSQIFTKQPDSEFIGIGNEEISFLKSTLYLNLLDNVLQRKDKVDVFCFFDENDKELLPDEYHSNDYKIFFEN